MAIRFIQGEEGRLIILFLAGLGAGFINVLAGGGSLLTLPVLIIAIYTLPTLLIFAWMGEVRWGIGATIAVGGVLGAWLATKVTLGRRGELWIKIAVVVMVGVMAAKLWV